MNAQKPVIAGVDGSPSSLAAADYAAGIADRRKVPLRLVHAFHGFSDPAAQDDIEEIMLAHIQRQRARHAGLAVTAQQIAGRPASVLIEQSRHALALVVGCRGTGGFAELLLGSVSAQVCAHGSGATIVVRPPLTDNAILPGPEQPERWPKPLGPVLACTDGSPGSALALRFAAEEAVSRNVQLIVAYVSDGPAEDDEKLLLGAVEPLEPIYSGPAIELRSIDSPNVAEALVEASRRAALMVVGSRGRGGFTGTVLGSVSRALTHHGYGPVAVIHPATAENE
jgi:nucleotide-binding universal stress UspA family protein